MFYIPQNECGRNCSLDTGLVKVIFTVAPLEMPPGLKEFKNSGSTRHQPPLAEGSVDWCKFENLTQLHTNSTSLFSRSRRDRLISLVQLKVCCFGNLVWMCCDAMIILHTSMTSLLIKRYFTKSFCKLWCQCNKASWLNSKVLQQSSGKHWINYN